MEKFYITTPIYYPSGKFHIGNAYATTFVDCIKRYKKARGYDAYMLTGLDEHGQKIQNLAEKREVSPQTHVNEMADEALKLWKLMDIKFDNFIRTTDVKHKNAVSKIVEKFLENGDIYEGEYEGWYCIPCETFFTETQLVDGKCPDCGREVKKTKEESYFFNMKKYQEWLINFYEENPGFIQPESRKTEIFNNFIKPGLEDLCISRTTFDWGIKMPNNPKHILYVWLDALTNYITALGYMSEDDSLFKKYWPADLHVVGKEITRFHGIYWPIFLKALGLEIPKQIYAHNWIVMKDGKMSKSVGNVVYPEMLIERYGVSATRYYLLKILSYAQDAVFTPESFVEKFNFDLCNDLGNLLNRTIGMVNKYCDGIIPTNIIEKTEYDDELESFEKKQIILVEENMDKYHVSNSLTELWSLISRVNKYIDETAPWTLVKQGEIDKLNSVMYHLVESLRKIGIILKPFMPETSAKILEQLGINSLEATTWDSIKNKKNVILPDTKIIEKGEPLFLRLDMEEEIEFIRNQMKK